MSLIEELRGLDAPSARGVAENYLDRVGFEAAASKKESGYLIEFPGLLGIVITISLLNDRSRMPERRAHEHGGIVMASLLTKAAEETGKADLIRELKALKPREIAHITDAASQRAAVSLKESVDLVRVLEDNYPALSALMNTVQQKSLESGWSKTKSTVAGAGALDVAGVLKDIAEEHLFGPRSAH